MLLRTTCLAVGAVLALSAAASAALTPEQETLAGRLIRDFTAAEFAVRQAAVDKLVAMGPDVLPLIKKTLAATKDAEVLLRCEMVVKAFGAPSQLAERPVKDPEPAAPPLDYRIARGDGKTRMVINGAEGPAYESIGGSALSPDGKRLAYCAFRAGEWVVVCDGKESPPCGKLQPRPPQFTSDSRHVFWVNRDALASALVVDGAPGAWHRDLFLPRGSAAERLGCVVQDFDENHLVKAAAVEVEWPATGQAMLVETVRRTLPVTGDMRLKPVRYAPRRGEAEVFSTAGKVTLGEPPNAQMATAELYFSPFGPAAAWAATGYGKDGKATVFFRGREFGGYEDLAGRWRFTFSPDGEHIAFPALHGSHWVAVRDGVEGPAWVEIEDLTVSPDWKHLAYRAKREMWGEPSILVVDDLISQKRPDVRDIAFSPDSRHVAYVASGRGRQFVVCDGIEAPPHEEIAMNADRRDGASDRLRYSVRDGGGAWTRVEVDWPAALDRTNGLEPLEP